jgi:hypothetical protein
MNRRGFLRLCGLAPAGVVAAPAQASAPVAPLEQATLADLLAQMEASSIPENRRLALAALSPNRAALLAERRAEQAFRECPTWRAAAAKRWEARHAQAIDDLVRSLLVDPAPSDGVEGTAAPGDAASYEALAPSRRGAP